MSLLFGKEVRSWRLTSSSVQNWGWTRSLREKVWSTPGLSPGGAGGGGLFNILQDPTKESKKERTASTKENQATG